MTKYTYKDFITGKQRWTRGKFAGWTEPTGLLNVEYAIFQRKSDDLLIPKYLLSKESMGILLILTAQRKRGEIWNPTTGVKQKKIRSELEGF